VILVIIDDLRADHLGCYGYPKQTSPAIDAIARDSCVFEKAFSQSGYTLPSTISILTSLYPSSHGMFYVFKDELSPGIKTIAEIFGTYGYKTAWFSQLKTPHLDINVGFGRGFQDKVELGADFSGGPELFSWLEKNRSNNFFLAIDSRAVHDFYRSFPEHEGEVKKDFYFKLIRLAKSPGNAFFGPEVVSAHKELFRGNYNPDKLSKMLELVDPEKRNSLDQFKCSLLIPWLQKKGRSDPEGWISVYDERIRAVDNELIKPLEVKLKTLGLCGKTVLIITADHGEEFAEHGKYGHSSLWDTNIHVPLIIKIPGGPGGKRIEDLAETIDIMPTVLELAGIAVPSQARGVSLVNLMRGGSVGAPREYIFSELPKKKTIRSKKWKLTEGGTRRRLFDLSRDPGEQIDVLNRNRAIAAKMQTRLKQWEASLPDYQDQEYPFDPGIGREMQERIRKTGYW